MGETAPVCFVDTETLGLDADINPVWEVAIIRPDGQEIVQQIRVSPRDISLAHPVALEMTGFAERYCRDKAIDPPQAAKRISKWLDGCHLAGAVVSFDEERLRRMCWKFRQPITWHYHIICVEALAPGKLGMRPPWNSTELSLAVGVDPADEQFQPKHTALADARWAAAIYRAVMGQ